MHECMDHACMYVCMNACPCMYANPQVVGLQVVSLQVVGTYTGSEHVYR